MELDPRTFIVTTTLSAFVMMIVFFAQARSFPDSIRGFKVWGLSLLMATVAAGMVAGRDIIPDLFSIVLGNAFMTVSISLMLIAISVFHDRATPWKLPLVCTIFIVVMMSYSINSKQDHIFRTTVASMVNISLFSTLAWSAFRDRHASKYRFGIYFTGICFAVVAAVCVVRLVTLFNEGAPHQGLLANTLIQRIYLASFSISVLLVSVGFSIMGHEKLVENYHALASKDELTGLYNRRHFYELAKPQAQRARRYYSNLSLILIDIDRFKAINDTYGHQAGDAVIVDVAKVMRSNFRGTDLYGRYGGEEFVALLPETTVKEAKVTAERMKKEIAQRYVSIENYDIHYSASFGIAQLCAGMELDQLVAQADKALYCAKNNGRNRVEVFLAESTDAELMLEQL